MPAARAIPLAILAGLSAALALLLAGTGNAGALIIGGMASLPVFMVGLGIGGPAMLIALVAGMAATVSVGGAGVAAAFAEGVALPGLILVPLGLAPPAPPTARRLVLGLTGLGVAIGAVAVAAAAHVGGIEPLLKGEIVRLLQQAERQSGLTLEVPAEQLARIYAFWAFGAVLAAWLLGVASNGLLAQGVLVRFGWNLRATPALASLELPRWVSLVFAAAVAAGCYGKGEVAFIGANLAEILAVPLLLGGLAVVHTAVRRHPARLGVLVGFYVIFFVTSVTIVPVALIVIVGVIEQWFGLRRRLAARPSRGEK